jgi:hypothetical protein
MKTTTLPSKHSINRGLFRLVWLVIPFALGCFALSPQAQAQCPQICDGSGNTALGNDALVNNTTGSFSTAIGVSALSSNTSGGNNTAIGEVALAENTTGSLNTAIGNGALWNNTTGFENTATGVNALQGNTSGINNTANGFYALNRNSTGSRNTATGFLALLNNHSSDNTADGQNALHNNTSGSNNIALGSNAGFNLTRGSNNIDIFDRGVAGEANTIRIGTAGTQNATFIAGISGATVPTGVAVIVDSSGHLGTTTSSARFKENIKPMDKASEAILGLKPVIFRYKKELDPEGIPQFGLVAEEVEKVSPDLVARDEQGKPYSVRYDAVNAMLLNEFLKEHRKVEVLEATAAHQQSINAEQQREIQALTASLNEQASQIQKVSAQLELSRPALRTVMDNH